MSVSTTSTVPCLHDAVRQGFCSRLLKRHPGSPVTGELTILAGNTTQVNFNFNSADIQHEVRVVSQLTGGGSYPDIFYISALDVWITYVTYSPYTFSVSQFAVVETTYVPTADVFYVTDLDVTASPYPEKCFVSNLDVNYTVNVTRPVCSSMEEFLANTKGYRFGFNGKEHDDETYGEGNIYDYGFRIYNPRIGKFLSVDPLTNKFAWFTPYQFAGNIPTSFIDIDGLENIYYSDKFKKERALKIALALYKASGLYDFVNKYFAKPDGVANNKYDMYVVLVTDEEFQKIYNDDEKTEAEAYTVQYKNLKGEQKETTDKVLKEQSLNVDQSIKSSKEALIVVVKISDLEVLLSPVAAMHFSFEQRADFLKIALFNLFHEQIAHIPHPYDNKLQLDPDPKGRNDHRLIYGEDYDILMDQGAFSPSWDQVTSKTSKMGKAKTTLEKTFLLFKKEISKPVSSPSSGS